MQCNLRRLPLMVVSLVDATVCHSSSYQRIQGVKSAGALGLWGIKVTSQLCAVPRSRTRLDRLRGMTHVLCVE